MYKLIVLLSCLILICVVASIYSSSNHTQKSVEMIMPTVIKELKEIEERTAIEQPEKNELDDLVSQYLATGDNQLLISIGDIWRKGAYSRMSSHNDIAVKYYELAANTDNREISALATAKYIEAKESDIQTVDDVGERLNDIYYEAVQAANANRAVPMVVDLPDNTDLRRLDEPEPPRIVEPPRPIQRPLFLDDAQNVHDHYMNRITKHNIKKLKSMVNVSVDAGEIINVVYVDDELTVESKAKVVRVIESCSTVAHKYFGCSELEALLLVYSFMKQQPTSKILYHNLFLQLLDCYSHGIIVCSTGKISRIISAIGDMEIFEDQRNIYYIKQELESLAFVVREEELKNMSPADITAYNNGSEEIADLMKEAYIKRVKDEYCTKLGIQYNIISPMVQTNLIGF